MSNEKKYVLEITWGEMKELISQTGSVRATLGMICNFIKVHDMKMDDNRLCEILMSCETKMSAAQRRLLEKFLKAVEKEEDEDTTVHTSE